MDARRGGQEESTGARGATRGNTQRDDDSSRTRTNDERKKSGYSREKSNAKSHRSHAGQQCSRSKQRERNDVKEILWWMQKKRRKVCGNGARLMEPLSIAGLTSVQDITVFAAALCSYRVCPSCFPSVSVPVRPAVPL